jgi:hypothetical protein
LMKGSKTPVRDAVSGSTRHLFLGDAWFSSVDLAVLARKEHDVNYVGVVKTNSSRFPKAYLQETMKDWPSGSYLNMSTIVDGVQLMATGYKYCSRKALLFLWNVGSGHTEAGREYKATWRDHNGNGCCRGVHRPSVVANYFEKSNAIDVSNQMRQYELRLEKVWGTHDGYFRLLTSLFGCNVIDTWRAYRFHLQHQHRHNEIGLMTFIDLLAHDMLHNDLPKQKALNDSRSIMLAPQPPPPTVVSPNQPIHINNNYASSNTTNHPFSSSNNDALHSWGTNLCREEVEENRRRHELVITDECEFDASRPSGFRTKRSICITTNCSRRTSQYCPTCDSANRDRHWLCSRCAIDHALKVSKDSW